MSEIITSTAPVVELTDRVNRVFVVEKPTGFLKICLDP